jgi:hypothetical protein
MTKAEYIARIIARALGHNDHNGMYWEKYILAAKLLIKENVIKEDHEILKENYECKLDCMNF